MPRICDYEGSKYRTEFWKDQNRAYEDAVERVAMAKLLPAKGERLLEIGAGFGRLADLYQGYSQVVLMDYARTQLEEAQNYLGTDERFIYVVADVYNLPFVNNLFETLTMVRVMHHLTDVPAALSEIERVIEADGVAVIEHASKFHLKSLGRWMLRRQDWNPFDPDPVEFVELNFNFHPAWMRQQFKTAGLRIKNIRSLSYYRMGVVKRFLPTSLLVTLDSWTQATGNWWQLSPSLFLQAQAEKTYKSVLAGFFCCPNCQSPNFHHTDVQENKDKVLVCQSCQTGWSFKDGIYDFKTPIEIQ